MPSLPWGDADALHRLCGQGHAIWIWRPTNRRGPSGCSPFRCDTAPPPTGELTLELTHLDAGALRLTWNDIRNPDEKADQIWYYQIFNGEDLIGTAEFDQTTFDIPADKAGGAFVVRAINNCFGASERSNTVSFTP